MLPGMWKLQHVISCDCSQVWQRNCTINWKNKSCGKSFWIWKWNLCLFLQVCYFAELVPSFYCKWYTTWTERNVKQPQSITVEHKKELNWGWHTLNSLLHIAMCSGRCVPTYQRNMLPFIITVASLKTSV